MTKLDMDPYRIIWHKLKRKYSTWTHDFLFGVKPGWHMRPWPKIFCIYFCSFLYLFIFACENIQIDSIHLRWFVFNPNLISPTHFLCLLLLIYETNCRAQKKKNKKAYVTNFSCMVDSCLSLTNCHLMVWMSVEKLHVDFNCWWKPGTIANKLIENW